MSLFSFSLMSKGGPMMWVLLCLGIVALVFFIERTLFLHRGQIQAKAFVDGIKNILAKRRIVEALTVCEETPGPVAAIVKAALLHAHGDENRLRYAVQEAAVVELPSLERRLGSIAAIAQVAPLVGLLGTVLGFITTFIAFERDYATASALAQGMWMALLSTAGSLLLAIPSRLAHHFLLSRVRSLVRDMEWSANEIMQYLLTEYQKQPAEAAAPAKGTAPAPATSPAAAEAAKPSAQP